MSWKQLAAPAVPVLQALCKLFGYKPGELTDKNVNSLMPPPFSQQHNAILARYKATGKGVLIGTGEAAAGHTAALHCHVCSATSHIPVQSSCLNPQDVLCVYKAWHVWWLAL